MAEIIRMPRLSDTMEEGVIVGWLKNEGDDIEPGDILAEVETDKATMELESYHEGTLLHIGVKEGAVPVNGVLAVIGEKGEDFQAQLDAELAKDASNEASADVPVEEVVATASASEAEVQTAQVESSSANGQDRIKASPLAKSMAADAGIDLARLQGSGDGGRIVKRDVTEAINKGGSTVGTEAFIATPGVSTSEPVSQMRKVIARRLSESKFSAPHFYVTVEIDMDNAIASRKQMNEDAPPKISFNDLVVKASAAALRKHPAINASWSSDSITYHGDVHIGVAVAVDDGLMVPVIQHADQKSLAQIGAEVREKAGRARERKLQPDEMQGNTFTISNLGMFDVDEFTAIINPPDACILAVGSIVQKPVVRNGEIVVGNTMKVTLSSDHRIVDGATAAQFLQTLRRYLEHPVKMLI
ncbi:MAG: pyruvate dehydrogenase complex dihydrolipoamide acetyltransferase [Saprospiraceae bacterium]|nr:pyruvate dehydrogenase complex dihydrolipoamide acetyltransferase [Saprospiraceae bacterium]